jgi:peroxiredoxin
MSVMFLTGRRESHHNRSRPSGPARLVLSLLTIALLAAGCARDNEQTTTLSFDLPELGGRGRVTSAQLDGKPIVLNFWATWCEPCREEMPAFEAVWQEFRDEGLVVLGVNLRDDPGKASAFARELDITYPLVRDPDEELARDLKVNGLPQTFFVSSSGKLAEGEQTVRLGTISEKELRDRVRELLGAKT